jgi:hypothetical protein
MTTTNTIPFSDSYKSYVLDAFERYKLGLPHIKNLQTFCIDFYSFNKLRNSDDLDCMRKILDMKDNIIYEDKMISEYYINGMNSLFIKHQDELSKNYQFNVESREIDPGSLFDDNGQIVWLENENNYFARSKLHYFMDFGEKLQIFSQYMKDFHQFNILSEELKVNTYPVVDMTKFNTGSEKYLENALKIKETLSKYVDARHKINCVRKFSSNLEKSIEKEFELEPPQSEKDLQDFEKFQKMKGNFVSILKKLEDDLENEIN